MSKRNIRMGGISYKGRGVYEDSDGDEYRKRGRKLVKIRDAQLGWQLSTYPYLPSRKPLTFFEKIFMFILILLYVVFWVGMIFLCWYFLNKFF